MTLKSMDHHGLRINRRYERSPLSYGGSTFSTYFKFIIWIILICMYRAIMPEIITITSPEAYDAQTIAAVTSILDVKVDTAEIPSNRGVDTTAFRAFVESSRLRSHSTLRNVQGLP